MRSAVSVCVVALGAVPCQQLLHVCVRGGVPWTALKCYRNVSFKRSWHFCPHLSMPAHSTEIMELLAWQWDMLRITPNLAHPNVMMLVMIEDASAWFSPRGHGWVGMVEFRHWSLQCCVARQHTLSVHFTTLVILRSDASGVQTLHWTRKLPAG